MEIAKIKTIIRNWREKFKIKNNKKKIMTSRRANRKIINILKGRRNVNRFKKKKKKKVWKFNEEDYYYDPNDIIWDGNLYRPSYYPQHIPSALPIPSAPPYIEEFNNNGIRDNIKINVKVNETMGAEEPMPS
jgi:hypothetical protein